MKLTRTFSRRYARLALAKQNSTLRATRDRIYPVFSLMAFYLRNYQPKYLACVSRCASRSRFCSPLLKRYAVPPSRANVQARISIIGNEIKKKPLYLIAQSTFPRCDFPHPEILSLPPPPIVVSRHVHKFGWRQAIAEAIGID